METQTSSRSTIDNRAKISALKDQLQKHPIASAVSIVAANFIFTLLILLLTKAYFPGLDAAFVGITAQTGLLILVLSGLGWWQEAGYNRIREWHNLNLLWLPALVILVPPFLLGIHPMQPGTLLYLLAGYLLTGITEEGIFRGLILRVLKPIGPTRAVIISAVLFGLSHLVNLLTRSNPLIVVAQCIGAFCDGAAFAAIRLKTNTLWPLILLHMLHDLLLKFTRLPAIPLDVAQVTILMIYGFYILQNTKAAPMTAARH
jgi:uncharacterized protein